MINLRIIRMISIIIAVLGLLTIISSSITAAEEVDFDDDAKVLDKESILATAEITSTANLRNNLLDLYFTEQNSDLWKYQWSPGQWGESCFHEHFGVYTANAGRTLESEDFTIDIPFNNPGGTYGTVSATLHYGDVQVIRQITLLSGDIRFFEIEYTIKNIGTSTLNDVRFFQTIDFDIPMTGDHTDDYAWYDSVYDYVIVNDDDYFENSFTGSRTSSRHGIAYFSTELYDDWDDGNLNNVNNYGPGDPGIGMQYNLGNIPPGAEEIVTITIWSGEPTEAMEPKFNELIFGDNKKHHTVNYPKEYNTDSINVLRRGQNFDMNAVIEDFDEYDHQIFFELTKPNGEIQIISAKNGGILSSEWDARYSRNGQNFNFQIHIPGNEQIGKYQLIGKIQKKGSKEIYDVFGDEEVAPEFYVLFNPWSSEDEDVFYPNMHELDFYITSSEGRQYYPQSGSSSWTLDPGNKLVFDTAIETTSQDISSFDSANKIMDKISYNAGHDGYHPWELGYEFDESKGANGYYQLGKDDPFDSSEILGGVWWNENDFEGHPRKTSSHNVPDILDTWLNNPDNNPYGQCMQFGGLGTSLLRSIGIPSRMVSIPDGKRGHNPSQDWRPTFHIWSEGWINNEWKEIATTYQDPNGPSSKCDALYQTEIHSNYEVDGSSDTDGFVDYVFTDQVVENFWFWWKLDKIDILDEYKECTETTSFSLLNTIELNQVEINVTTDKTQYNLGENVVLNVTIINDGDVSINNINTEVINFRGYGVTRYVWRDLHIINIPAHTTYYKEYILSINDYKYDGEYQVFSNIDNIANSAEFNVIGGINITVSLPETVLINETFTVTLEANNTLDVPITNIEIQADFPYYAVITDSPTIFSIPSLGPGETNTTSWNVKIPEDGYQSITFIAQSDRGDYKEMITGIEVMSNPFLRLDVEVPASVKKDSTFSVSATILNDGDLAAQNVQSELSLPPEMTTSENTIKYVGTIPPHENTIVMWNINANEAGTSAFTIMTSSSSSSTEDVVFIPIFIYDHDINLSVEQSEIESDDELHIINMVIHNFGNVDDSILLESLITDSNISLSIYDGNARIISQPVIVPANGDKTLDLKIIPEFDATGLITIHAISELDPTASDSISIEVIPSSINIAAVGVYDNMGTWALWNGASADIVGFGWSGTEPVVGDWNGDGSMEVGIYNRGGNNFLIQTDTGFDVIGLGWADVTPVIGDWNADGSEEVGVYDNMGTWALWNGASADIVGFGWPGTEPIVGDWDGDGVTEVGIYNTGGNNFLIQTDTGFDVIGLGWADVTPVIGDWNADGSEEVGVYDNMGTWALWNGASADIVGFGWPGTEPIVGDWDGDGVTEVGIYNTGGNNFLIQTDTGFDVIGLGWAGVTPVVGDWNGDGSDKVGVYDNMGTWALWNGASADIVGFGWSGTEPVVGDWNGDGLTEVGIYNTGGNNFLVQSDTGFDVIGLGWMGVTPVVGYWS